MSREREKTRTASLGSRAWRQVDSAKVNKAVSWGKQGTPGAGRAGGEGGGGAVAFWERSKKKGLVIHTRAGEEG